MTAELKPFISYIIKEYGVTLVHPDDFTNVYKRVGAVLISQSLNKNGCIREFFKKSKYCYVTAFSGDRLIIRQLDRASSGSGKNKTYLQKDYTLSSNAKTALYLEESDLRDLIRTLKKKKPVMFKGLKFDYDFALKSEM